MNYLSFDPATGAVTGTLTTEVPPASGHWLEVAEIGPIANPGEWAIVEGVPVRVSIELTRQAARAELARACGNLRQMFISDIPGQDMIYLDKEAEAGRFVADPDPELTHYPFLQAETGILAPTAWEVAQIWLNMGAIWRVLAARLEGLRMAAGNAIDAAGTEAEIEVALEALRIGLEDLA